MRGSKAYMIGGGIASLAGAAYLVRDGTIAGTDVHIFEEMTKIGGSLDGSGSAEGGYVSRGQRIFTYETSACTLDLLSFIPSLDVPDISVRDEIIRFNEQCVFNPLCRLVSHGKSLDVADLGLAAKDKFKLITLMATPEFALGTKRIDDIFRGSFFKTNFWYRLCSTFAFQRWHSAAELRRYLYRFIHEFPRIRTHPNVKRTPFNQYDSIVQPLARWLEDRGVCFITGATVLDLDFRDGSSGKSVERIRFARFDRLRQIDVSADDLVFVTNGSMTAGSSLGTMDSPARLNRVESEGSWALWKTLASRYPEFGRPEVFTRNVDQSKWLSFTVTLNEPTFFKLMEAFTGNRPGADGLITFVDSNWLISIMLPPQPHFRGQPDGVQVFWGYGLMTDETGNFVAKKMSECSGAELLMEVVGHLRFNHHMNAILRSAICIPCMMPLIASQFMPRTGADRPRIRPAGTTNFAFIGQFCEMPDEVVFTVEYSVRSAQTAVFSLLNSTRKVSPLLAGHSDPRIMLAAAKALIR
jgi:oleate hydratase